MADSQLLSARYVHITGVVQGVGFRPFVYNLATGLGLSGWVLNSSSGVEIEAVGSTIALDQFVERLQSEAPPISRIEQITVTDIPNPSAPAEQETQSVCSCGAGDPIRLLLRSRRPNPQFIIRHSEGRPGEFQPISPDISVCDDCLRELFDPDDRRYRYPFINCTNCGPRFTIIQDIPYDRPKTTMSPFEMCPACQAEYDDPTNRRFHAQPNACPVCGPQVWLQVGESQVLRGDEAVLAVRKMLVEGGVVAIKGLGGFHLACDATNDKSVALLRERKGRVDKPFALMAFDCEMIERFCYVNEDERALLASRERPIVLLRERAESFISPLVAPGNRYLGVMLSYTPLHYLLLELTGDFPLALVMTSGNLSEEPIATGNDEALARLSGLADGFLLHDRDIHARCDDSVTRIFAGAELPARRSRGYAPYPVHLPFPARQVLAVGGELKNTFCLTRERYAFLSQHIGDMENYETLRSFERMVEQLQRTFRIKPEIIAHDMHPGYLTTRYAREQVASGKRQVAVQHHHAHIASCMAENGLTGERPVIGVAFDGTGYGVDGAIWGGEFLIADYASFRRAAHLKYVPLPGGDAAIRRPYRIALAHLWAAGVEWEEDLSPVAAASSIERAVLARQLERELNTVPTSSVGRLFDAVSALAGVRQEVNYEAQAAIELENLVLPDETGAYPFELASYALRIDPAPCIRAVVADARAGTPAGVIAARFHNGLARMMRDVCLRLREESGLDEVALSGGVFQNVALLGKSVSLLREAGFTVYTHHLTPPNDGGISLGQAVVASARE
ncbi:MAG: carbamoyltransferase HypF [Chloroflexi bacterium]|nr:MAG: carbamoyltransferase HypF [Anaerolineaceae bacterium 4572_32.2]RLC85968.1 MAG: carbamoyltransferase HypF [Chloroflexota bacterium]